jgi:hypothetical protein
VEGLDFWRELFEDKEATGEIASTIFSRTAVPVIYYMAMKPLNLYSHLNKII